jgi:hypothetical protein
VIFLLQDIQKPLAASDVAAGTQAYLQNIFASWDCGEEVVETNDTVHLAERDFHILGDGHQYLWREITNRLLCLVQNPDERTRFSAITADDFSYVRKNPMRFSVTLFAI